MPPPKKRPGKVMLGKGYSQLDWMRLQKSSADLAGTHFECVHSMLLCSGAHNASLLSEKIASLEAAAYKFTYEFTRNVI